MDVDDAIDESTKGVTATACPYCGYYLDAATAVEDQGRPEEGDLSVCLKCTGVLIYNEHGKPCVLTDAERDALPADDLATLQRVQTAIRRQR